jgi:hypothetical protein
MGLTEPARATSFRASLLASREYGRDAGMSEMRKITVEVPRRDLESAQAQTGQGVTETVRAALRKLASARAQQELRKLRGKVKFSMTLEEMRYDRE